MRNESGHKDEPYTKEEIEKAVARLKKTMEEDGEFVLLFPEVEGYREISCCTLAVFMKLIAGMLEDVVEQLLGFGGVFHAYRRLVGVYLAAVEAGLPKVVN